MNEAIKSQRTRCRCGFTLIELMVSVAIIMILIALLLPAIGRAREATKRAKARQHIKGLETALRAYYDEYRQWPGNLNGYGNWPGDKMFVEANINGIQMWKPYVDLFGGEDVNGENPKLIPFFEIPAQDLDAQGKFLDPWGQPYKFMADYNLDNDLEINFTSFLGKTNLTHLVGVWSVGPDGADVDGMRKDDVTSW